MPVLPPKPPDLEMEMTSSQCVSQTTWGSDTADEVALDLPTICRSEKSEKRYQEGLLELQTPEK